MTDPLAAASSPTNTPTTIERTTMSDLAPDQIAEGERSLPRKYCQPCGEHAAVADSQGVWRCPNPDHPAVPGEVHKVVARGDSYKGRPFTAPYLAARIDAVHSYGCPATRMGQRSGPCNCGARDLMVAFLAEHADDPWHAITHLQDVERRENS